MDWSAECSWGDPREGQILLWSAEGGSPHACGIGDYTLAELQNLHMQSSVRSISLEGHDRVKRQAR